MENYSIALKEDNYGNIQDVISDIAKYGYVTSTIPEIGVIFATSNFEKFIEVIQSNPNVELVNIESGIGLPAFDPKIPQ